MLNLPECHVLTQDDAHPEMEGAYVVVVGESPNCTVRLAVRDMTARKWVTLDRLMHASFTRQGDTWTFKGQSEHLRDTVGADDTNLQMQATPEPGCAECRK
jgi:hypothetical protein